MHTKTVPCLVEDPTGSTMITLYRGPRSSFQYPDWRCEKWECEIRGKRLPPGKTVYDALQVKLGNKENVHGVLRCEGGGSVERRRR